MKLIVGLGNPGKEYEKTRQNIGFIFIDALAKKLNISIDKEKFNGLYTTTIINGEKVVLLKPLSYMNLSGEVVIRFKEFYKIDIKDILVISDDLDMEFGKIRLRQNGSSGGHNGLKNIELHLHSSEYKRLKIGISNNKMIDTKDYVLGKFSEQEIEIIENLKSKVTSLLLDFINEVEFTDLMSKYNGK